MILKEKNIKCVLFDLDGTLVDTVDLHYQALNLSLQANQQPIIDIKTNFEIYNGLPTKTKLEMLNIDKKLFPKIIYDKQQHTLELIDKLITKDKEKLKLLNLLGKKDYGVGIVSNCSRLTGEKLLQKGVSPNYKSHIILEYYNSDFVNPKPSSEPYTRAIVELSQSYMFSHCILSKEKVLISPQNFVIVEDSELGYTSAVNTGANVIRINSPKEVNVDLFKGVLY